MSDVQSQLQSSLLNSSCSDEIAPVVIRGLAASDSMAELTDFLHAAYRPLADAGMRYVASFQDEVRTRERCMKGETFIAEVLGKVAGTITLSSVENTKGSPWYDRPDVTSFGQFAVAPSLQKLGLGSLLMEKVETRALQQGIKELALDTSENAAPLIRYYQCRGYRFIEYAQWRDVNYRSVILSKTL